MMDVFTGIAIAGYLAQGLANIIDRNHLDLDPDTDLVKSEVLAEAEYLAYLDFLAYKQGRSPGPCWAWGLLFDEMNV